MPQLMNNSRR